MGVIVLDPRIRYRVKVVQPEVVCLAKESRLESAAVSV